ncbi:MAG: hypothetical protein EOO02_02290 [Chitinophagaceae bacterium]|nr:MAG: hypothetical protein EOO02_02290 [Chitinophagaceae bacterium]
MGSGKTTATRQAAQQLISKNIKTGIITNDQGNKLVDGGLFKHLNIPNREVVDGCFCCNYGELDTNISSLVAEAGAEIIFAESVGSCTDIVATVLKPLLKFRTETQVTVSTFADARLLQMMLGNGAKAFDESVRYIYFKQLEEASVIVINKIDLINEDELALLRTIIVKKYGDKILLFQNSNDKQHIEKWIDVLNAHDGFIPINSLDIDYDLYAAGEANLAWVDQEIELFSADGNGMQEAALLIANIFKAIKEKNYVIGHLKFLINNSIKISLTSPGDQLPSIDFKPCNSVDLLINMRVQTLPENVTSLIADAILQTELDTGCRIAIMSSAAFQPGYPSPEHRL